MSPARALVVIADDFGMGPGTSAGILELAERGRVTGSVLMVNSPYADDGVRAWRKAGQPMELGWHVTLTSDSPVLPIREVPSLVGSDGRFWSLGIFVKRLFFGQIAAAEIQAELRAQYALFWELVGHAPTLVNSHQHVVLFHPVGHLLLDLLARRRPLPYVRCVREPWRMLWRIPGARIKRWFISWLGKPQAKRQLALGFPGSDWLAGVTDPRWVRDPKFLVRWLTKVPGDVVELACHPGHRDQTLIGRDCTEHDGLRQRRVDEFYLLGQPSFLEACEQAGFERVAPGTLAYVQEARTLHAA